MKKKNIPEKEIDVTGIEITPGKRDVCLGNGEQGFDCCCDECDYFLLCYPEFDFRIKKEVLYECSTYSIIVPSKQERTENV